MINDSPDNKNPFIKDPLIVTLAVCQEYERQSGLHGICILLQQRGLIKIVSDEVA